MKSINRHIDDSQPFGEPVDLTDEQLADFVRLWHECVVDPHEDGLTEDAAERLSKGDVHLDVNPECPDVLRLALPDTSGRFTLFITIESRGDWRPLPLLNPGELDCSLQKITARLAKLSGKTGKAIQRQVRDIHYELEQLRDGVVAASNPADDIPAWNPIPEGEPLTGCVTILPVDQDRGA